MKPFHFILILFACVSLSTIGYRTSQAAEFKISSPAYENNGGIPGKYTCDGANINPPLRIENVPLQAKSLVLIFDDIDAPGGSYVHWILWNIDPTTREIKEDSVPEGAVQGTNDFKKQNYGGPCPPTRPHRYAFKVYALDTPLGLSAASKKADLEKAMKGHVIGRSQWLGQFKKSKSSPK
ncbi:MAG: YbhB/YbcL family Raf kinase inhibitor-like protein [Thermodesulfobacteriota bacterium]